ncbi:MAG TPA: hypothetical protein VN374_08335, partial [Desulfitobacteriaceae bacterium]|nr:hypothetical protein [Desulfitobacteriaceae bacterium]
NQKHIIENAISVLDELNRPRLITELAKERIRRAGKRVAEDILSYNAQLKVGQNKKPLVDTGFRVFKLDNSNMKIQSISACRTGVQYQGRSY